MARSSAQAAVGAPVPLRLGDDMYLLSPMGPGDAAAILTWLERQPYEAARRKLEALGDQATDDYRERTFAAADEEAAKVALHPDGVLQVFEGLEEAVLTGRIARGFTYFVMVMLQKEHPDIDWQTTGALISPQNLPAIIEKIEEVNREPGKAAARKMRRVRTPRRNR